MKYKQSFSANKNFIEHILTEAAKIALKARSIRCVDSVFDAMAVASGKYGAFLNQGSRIWDNVAQQIIIEEAGGLYTDFFGKDIDYSNPLKKTKDNFTFCAAPPILHKQLKEIIHKQIIR